MSVASDPDDYASPSWRALYPGAQLDAEQTAHWLAHVAADGFNGIDDTVRAVALRLAYEPVAGAEDTPWFVVVTAPGSPAEQAARLGALDHLLTLGWIDPSGYPLPIEGMEGWR
jgi:hypothetical protein